MSSKKSKKKKNKKEERVSSSCLHEDEKKERDSKKLSSSKSHTHHRHHHRHESVDKEKSKGRRASDSSTQSISLSKARLTKTDVVPKKSKEEVSLKSKATENSRTVKSHITEYKEKVTARRKHDNTSPTISGKSFSRHTATNQPSSKELESQRQKLVSRRSAPEKPKPAHDDSPSKEQEKRRKLLKRSLSPEHHTDVKRRDEKNVTSNSLAHRESQSEALKEMRKKLVSRRSKEFDQAVGVNTSHDKTVKSLPVVKHVDSATKPKLPEDCSHKKQDERQCPAFMPKISFKIPKKASTVKAQRNTDIWNVHLAYSRSRTRCNSQACLTETVVAGSPSTNTSLVSKRQEQTPQKVLASTSNPLFGNRSSHPLHLNSVGAVQQVQTDKSKDVTTPSVTSCKFQEICNAYRDPRTERSSVQGQKQEYHLKTQEPAETFDCDHEMQLVEELHLARSERRLDLNLVENCGELTCMDIDPPEEGTSLPFNEEQHQQSLLIVLDTNVLLSHLEFVKKIRSHGLAALGFPTLLIPWVVLQELDYLKSGKLSSNVEGKARPAVHYIYSCLKNQEPRLLGQSMQQASQAVCGPGVVNNDDRVLACCLQYQALYPEGAVVLCTDDKNLCSKALLSGVKALSKADLVKEVEENRLSIINYLCAPPAASTTVGNVEKDKIVLAHRPPAREKSQERTRNDPAEEPQLSDCVSILESCLQGALSEVLEEEMKAAFGELWTEIVYVKPPWNLDGVLKCFKKHWIAVFGIIIKRSLLSCVEMLSDCLCSNRSIERASVLSAVRGATELLSALTCRSPYSMRVDQALSTLHMLQQRLQSPKASLQGNIDNEDNEDSLMAEVEDEASPPHACHEEVWALFESIWNNVCQISSALFSVLHYSPGATEPSPRATTPPPQEALSCLHRLSSALKQLLGALHRVLSVDGSVQDAQLLLSFIQTSEIAAMEPRFTARDLFDFVSQQEYREKLRVGGAQLSELSANLDHCTASLSYWT
ncbi:transcriptional protein SWT1 [Triplophysa rosa]|uniref:Transcriptional protein SWT1 n=1 Tax=Triplophysa rosa TaxID=992332 RepID=A0A9W7TNG9_TRIRA|nr:transcriptional protein SWT1 [Triplophysa rosa]KAI7799626.1 putative transcriptional protein SWT1 [Triplophysa rosa]